MRTPVNKKGHEATLVAAHPQNRNAVKSGVYSPATRAPRMQELEAAIGERPANEVIIEQLQRELAALIALAEAMDRSLTVDGCLGRGGEPRTLIDHRLRLNDRLRKTMDQYAWAVGLRPPSGQVTVDSLETIDAQIALLTAELQERADRKQGSGTTHT